MEIMYEGHMMTNTTAAIAQPNNKTTSSTDEILRRIASGDRLITVKDRAKITGEPLGSIYSRVHRGDTRFVKIGDSVRFWLTDLAAELAAGS